MQHRALNWIEEGSFRDAWQVSGIAVEIAQKIFAATAPANSYPKTNARGDVTPGAYRQWFCKRVKEGAERIG